MTNRDVIRAWKDEEYREGLGEAELARLPENPAGAVELPDAELQAVAGGVPYASLGLERCSFVDLCSTRGYPGRCRY